MYTAIATPTKSRKKATVVPTVLAHGTLDECIQWAEKKFCGAADLDTFKYNVVPIYTTNVWDYWILKSQE